MDSAGEHNAWRKYYINVCRPLSPVPGCDRYAAACQMKYVKDQVSPPPGRASPWAGVASPGLPDQSGPGHWSGGLCVSRLPPRVRAHMSHCAH